VESVCAAAHTAAKEMLLERKTIHAHVMIPAALVGAFVDRGELMPVLRSNYMDAYESTIRWAMWAKVDGRERVEFPSTWWDAVKLRWLPVLPGWLRRRFAPPGMTVVSMERYALYPTIPLQDGLHLPLTMFERHDWQEEAGRE
jgi:hypothetical protein